MLRDITIGQHFPGNSILHTMDPRVKLLLTIAYIVMLFVGSNPAGTRYFHRVPHCVVPCGEDTAQNRAKEHQADSAHHSVYGRAESVFYDGNIRAAGVLVDI